MKQSCQYCGGIHEKNILCSRRPVRQYKKRDTKIDKFRKTRVWQEKRLEILQRDKGLCRMCFPTTINHTRLQVHHIIPMVENWDKRLEEDNLITLCSFHHTLAEQGEIKATELQTLVNIPPEEQLKKTGEF